MGATASRKSEKLQQCFIGRYECEVLVTSRRDNASSQANSLYNSWCIMHFIQKDNILLVSKDEVEIERIQLDQNFEVVNEQPDELIFTIRFTSNQDVQSQWKIRCRLFEEYLSWTNCIKKTMRHKWTNASQCQVWNI
jgi:CRISPR/Cas system-associated protein Cas10 (large subunit of type III CRISPR-Cas system)